MIVITCFASPTSVLSRSCSVQHHCMLYKTSNLNEPTVDRYRTTHGHALKTNRTSHIKFPPTIALFMENANSAVVKAGAMACGKIIANWDKLWFPG